MSCPSSLIWPIYIAGEKLLTMLRFLHNVKTNNLGFPACLTQTGMDSHRSLRFEEGLYYLCSENIDTDQLFSYCIVDLCLFSHMLIIGFLVQRLNCFVMS